jgi:hypothetical protein
LSELVLNDGGNDIGKLSDAVDIIKGWSPFNAANYDGVVVYDDGYVVGPTVGLDFDEGISAELDGDKVKVKAYRPANYSITINSVQAASEQVILASSPPFPSLVRVLVEGGPEQINGVDFAVSGNVLSWQNKGLSGFLSIDDEIIVVF